MPEIGISGLPLDYPYSGSATYTRNLIRELPIAATDLQFRVFLRQARESRAGNTAISLASPFALMNRGRGVGARLDKLAWEIGTLPVAAALKHQAILHSTYFASPAISKVPVVVTVHDVIPLILPGYHRSRQAEVYARLMRWAVPHVARAILTVSEHARADIIRTLGVPEEQVYVVYEAVDERFRPDHRPETIRHVREKYRLPERFVLYLGGAERRKNVEILIRAWALRARSLADRDVQLVIVARFPAPDELYPDTVGLAHSLGISKSVLFLPYVDEVDKPAIYAAAMLFCFPSTYEGFGLPPLEAMASGVPTIASHATSLPEVVGDGGVLLPPDDADLWSRTIERLLDSSQERAVLAERGLARAATFSWRTTALETAAVYRSVLAQ